MGNGDGFGFRGGLDGYRQRYGEGGGFGIGQHDGFGDRHGGGTLNGYGYRVGYGDGHRDRHRYPWGSSINCTTAVYAGCSEGRTAEVCSVPAGNTDQGLCDMAGNVTELVQDNYHATYTGAPTDGSAWFDGGGVQVLRSGNFSQTVLYARTTDRWSVHYQLPQYGIGFRCAR